MIAAKIIAVNCTPQCALEIYKHTHTQSCCVRVCVYVCLQCCLHVSVHTHIQQVHLLSLHTHAFADCSRGRGAATATATEAADSHRTCNCNCNCRRNDCGFPALDVGAVHVDVHVAVAAAAAVGSVEVACRKSMKWRREWAVE